MSIQNEIDRIEIAKENIANAIGNLGVTIPSGTSLSAFPDYISAIVLGMDQADYDADSAVKNAGGIAAYGNANYEPKITAGASTQYWRGDKTWATLDKSAVGLKNVANERQYSSSNPPPYPVTSINSKTGAVTLSASDVGALPSSTIIPSAPGTLKTNATTAQTASSGQSMSENITLHKISKTGNYNDLLNKPTIPSAVTESTVSGWGFTKNTGTYSKPSNGIPKTDLASGVQTSLGKADTALQSITDESITRAKLNTDALYSPIKTISSDYTLTASDIGKTIMTYSVPSGTTKITITVPYESFPQGAEFAILRYASNVDVEITHAASVYFGCSAWGSFSSSTSKKLKISNRAGMVSIKRIFGSSHYYVISGEYEDA